MRKQLRKQLTDQFPEICTEVSEVFVDVVCAPQDSMFDQFREKSFVPQYGDEEIGGETTWLLGLYPAQRSLPVMFLQRVVI